MNESISLMVEEHENIRRMLRVLRAMCRSVMHGEEVDQADFAAAIDFIRIFIRLHRENPRLQHGIPNHGNGTARCLNAGIVRIIA